MLTLFYFVWCKMTQRDSKRLTQVTWLVLSRFGIKSHYNGSVTFSSVRRYMAILGRQNCPLGKWMGGENDRYWRQDCSFPSSLALPCSCENHSFILSRADEGPGLLEMKEDDRWTTPLEFAKSVASGKVCFSFPNCCLQTV